MPVIPPVQITSLTPLECDICSAIRTELLYFATGEFRLTLNGQTIHAAAGSWGACEACAPLVISKDLQGLIRRTRARSAIQTACSFGLMKGILSSLLPEPSPILTPIRLVPHSGRWVEYHGDKPATGEANPYVSDN